MRRRTTDRHAGLVPRIHVFLPEPRRRRGWPGPAGHDGMKGAATELDAPRACRRGDRMRRREFVTLLGGCGCVFNFFRRSPRAQELGAGAQRAKLPTVGILALGNPPPDPEETYN